MATRHFDQPEDLFEHQLRSALTMEHDSLGALKKLGGSARSKELKDLLSHHEDETREQIQNLERSFELLELEQKTAPSPATKALIRQGSGLLERSDRKLLDTVVVSAALGTEHHEISAYESLIIAAESMGLADVQSLLEHNLEQEQHTSEELAATARRLAGAMRA